MDQSPSKFFVWLRSAVANATDLLLFPPVPGLERPGCNQFAALRRYLRLNQKLKNYTTLGETPALPGPAMRFLQVNNHEKTRSSIIANSIRRGAGKAVYD
jgi:hypothetical protein